MIAKAGWDKSMLHIGCSKTYGLWKVLNLAFKEAIYASEYACTFQKDYVEFKNMGIYQILIPRKNDLWVVAYCEDMLNKLRDYDTKYNTELYDTIEEYIQFNYDIARVAEHMHKNSVRYRISKAREVMEMEEEKNDGIFIDKIRKK